MKQEMPTVFDFVYTPQSKWKGNTNVYYYQFEIVSVCGDRLTYLSRESGKFRKNFESIANGEAWATKKIEEHMANLAAEQKANAAALLQSGQIPVPIPVPTTIVVP